MPKTVMLDVSDSIRESVKSRFNFPVIFKPLDGVGCSGLSLVKDESQVVNAVAKINAELASERFIVQEFLEGDAVSVSLLCTQNKALAVSLNKQQISLSEPDQPSGYNGGYVPYDHNLKKKAFETAEAVVSGFPGLRGYVGVDLILTKDNHALILDVNPRLTTSFVGLSRVAGFNFADALVKAAINGELPTSTPINGFSVFSKVETSKPEIGCLEKLYTVPGVVSPPFPDADFEKSCALVSGEGNSLDIADAMLEEAKKNVLNIV
jgi:hypothetical protein